MARMKAESMAASVKKKKKGGKKRHLFGPMVASMKASKSLRPNPFETIWSRRKFDILGKKKSKGEEVRIGLSRSLAIEKRKKTLMKEYEECSKSAKFIDRRLGEKDDTLLEFDKAIMRLQRERQSKLKRMSKYNLSDEEEDFTVPQAHLLSELDDFDEQLPLDNDEDDGIAGVPELPRNLQSHDSLENELHDVTEMRRKSNKQAYAEVIAKDKYFKAKKAEEREEINREIAALNKLTDELDERLISLNSQDLKHSTKKQSDDMFDSYSKIMGELHFEPRARPSDRTKTPEEIAQEEKEALEKLEEERLNRMEAIDEDEGYDDTEDEVKPSSRLDRYVSGDDLGDSFSTIKNGVNEKGWVDAIFEREENEEHEEEDCSSSEGSENNEDDQEGTDDDNASDGCGAKGVEYADMSAIHVWQQSDADDDIGVEEGQEPDEKEMTKANIDVLRADSVICHKIEVNDKCAQAQEGLPYVIEAPKTLTEICSLLDNRSDVEVVEIIRRIRAYNSISLGAENRRKMQVFYGVLISYFAALSTQKPLNVKIINSLVKPLIETGTEVPYFASVCARERLIRIRAQFSDDVKIPDFRHVVMTPVILLMCEYLMHCPITCGRDIAIGSFLCYMLLSVSKESQKFYPEVISFFQMILMSSMERNSKIEQPSQCNLEIKVSKPWLRIHDEGCTVHQIDLFTVLELQDDSPYFISESFKASILSIVVKILIEYVNMYQGLSSFPEIFLPIAAMLDEVLEGAKLPRNLQENMEKVADLIRKQASEHQLSRQPLQMRKQRPEPIKLMNPKFEENFVKGIDYDPDRERAQRKKLKKLLKKEAKGAVRELRKDNHFISELKMRDRILQEEERSEKYGKALAFLQEQEHAFKSGQLGKGRKRRK
ncbi:nucleolar protein 14 isoform X2 [Phalaenopsis equestris]|uniref:nucleolar protein 14 isoform X2 n=1 Tax=Phalaenopsis equestris TaxID=78828 RepID=UPI0009E1EAC2|nr:nucleolar protein 14 isoform X2 [Phalaenopsis equestris]